MGDKHALRPHIQDLSRFKVPPGFRGRPAWMVQMWWLVQSTLFRWSPQIAYPFRAALLRRFGAEIGINTIIRPSAVFTYPWKISIGDYAWIGDNTVLYSLGEIQIGAHSVISQGSYLCAGDHDYKALDFSIRARAIHVGAEVWVAARCYVGPGVTIGSGTVVGAHSGVFSDLPERMLCIGSPCRPIHPR